MAYGQKVEISTKKAINDIVISVDDDGPGIPEKEYRNVMRPFYRIDKSRGQNKSGVGLGLSITNDIVMHKKIAKITFPLWLYVAVTGVIVYLMISPYYLT